MDHLAENKELSTLRIANEIFYKVIYCFTYSIPSKKLMQEVYLEVQAKKMQFKCGFYAYFVMSAFLLISQQFNEVTQLRQVRRTMLCLRNMVNICQIKIRSDLLRLGKTLVTFHTKRKSFIYLRKQAKITSDEARMRSFVHLIKKKV